MFSSNISAVMDAHLEAPQTGGEVECHEGHPHPGDWFEWLEIAGRSLEATGYSSVFERGKLQLEQGGYHT